MQKYCSMQLAYWEPQSCLTACFFTPASFRLMLILEQRKGGRWHWGRGPGLRHLIDALLFLWMLQFWSLQQQCFIMVLIGIRMWNPSLRLIHCLHLHLVTMLAKILSKTSLCFYTLFKQVAKIYKNFNKFLLPQLVYSQRWLNSLFEGCQQCGNIKKLKKKKKNTAGNPVSSLFLKKFWFQFQVQNIDPCLVFTNRNWNQQF